jgi:hypothetical protein
MEWYIELAHFFSTKPGVKNKLIVFLKHYHIFNDIFNIKSAAFTEAKVDRIFLGYQPCQLELVKNY